MPVLSFLLTICARWLAVARALCADALAAYKADGLRAALFEVEIRARSLHALALGAPLICGELIATVRETENLRAAWHAGIAPEAYVRRRCESLGVAIGSPTYLCVVAWAWSLVNFWNTTQVEGGSC